MPLMHAQIDHPSVRQDRSIVGASDESLSARHFFKSHLVKKQCYFMCPIGGRHFCIGIEWSTYLGETLVFL